MAGGCEVIDFVAGGLMSSSDDEEDDDDLVRVLLTGSASEVGDGETDESRDGRLGLVLEVGGRVGFAEGLEIDLEVVEVLDVLTGRGGLNAGRGFFAVSLGGMTEQYCKVVWQWSGGLVLTMVFYTLFTRWHVQPKIKDTTVRRELYSY